MNEGYSSNWSNTFVYSIPLTMLEGREVLTADGNIEITPVLWRIYGRAE
jgi:hypothetical protein